MENQGDRKLLLRVLQTHRHVPETQRTPDLLQVPNDRKLQLRQRLQSQRLALQTHRHRSTGIRHLGKKLPRLKPAESYTRPGQGHLPPPKNPSVATSYTRPKDPPATHTTSTTHKKSTHHTTTRSSSTHTHHNTPPHGASSTDITPGIDTRPSINARPIITTLRLHRHSIPRRQLRTTSTRLPEIHPTDLEDQQPSQRPHRRPTHRPLPR
jgi:hypothetical protein